MRRAKSLRNGVHHADAVVWGPVYRTRLNRRVLASKLLAHEIHRLRRLLAQRPVVLVRRRAQPLRDHARHDGRHELMQVQLDVHVRVRHDRERRRGERAKLRELPESRSVRANVGVELKGVSWS